MGYINIKNMKFYTFIGVFEEENKLGQQIEIDFKGKYPIEDIKGDDISLIISYVDIYENIKTTVKNYKPKLIEALANKIIDNLSSEFKDSKIEKIQITIRKGSVPMEGIFDEIEISVEKKI